MRQVTLGEFLTDSELRQIETMKDRRRVRDEIIKPNIDRINKVLGQENDVDYLSLAIEYAMVARRVWP
jgi:hypothetical protein